ncbi:hypothetical protein DPMN_142391 [Dreissena polymorpha]|uniref:Uncharacterized protein n=1 Tax=Dreissena polymorpha TaxID=45954 RepID=A0A9D4JM57_DREPO|nr:hypothetical protein DPMN_142391 [Dreissena polymorpha]
MKTFQPTYGVVLESQPRTQARYTLDYDEVNMHSQPGAGASGYTASRSMAEVNMG